MFNWLVTKSIFYLEVFYIKQELPINEQIRAKEVQLIGAEGEKVGVVSLNEALDKAADADLDLVLVAPNVNPPVCKIMNYGKYKFEQAKKEKEAKKKQKVLEVKEIRVTPNIEKHDFEFKSRNAKKFIDGDPISLNIIYCKQDGFSKQQYDSVVLPYLKSKAGLTKLQGWHDQYCFDDGNGKYSLLQVGYHKGGKWSEECFDYIIKPNKMTVAHTFG